MRRLPAGLPWGHTLRSLYWLFRQEIRPGGALRHPVQALRYWNSPIQRRARRSNRETLCMMRRVLRPSGTGIDVGAAIGSILRPMVDIAPSGRHLAFEPIPARADMPRRTFPHVTVVAGALSDASGTAPFGHVVWNASLTSSMLPGVSDVL